LRAEADALGVKLDDIGEAYSEKDATELIKRLTDLKTKGFDKLDVTVDKANEGLEGFGKTCRDVKGDIEASTEAFEDMSETASQQKAFEDKIKSFLGV
jgi:hypothetical protein